MDTIGLDLHKREIQLCMLTEAGEIVERRIVTSRERFTAVLGGRGRARILVEASTESEWVAQHLAVRDALIRTRTRYVSVVKSLARRDGLRRSSRRMRGWPPWQPTIRWWRACRPRRASGR